MRKLIAILMLATAASATSGVPVIYQTAGSPVFRFEVPDNWALRTGQDTPVSAMPAGEDPAVRVLSLMPQDGAGGMWAGLWSPRNVSGLDAAVAHVKNIEGRILDGAKVTATRDLALPAGPARMFSGTGKRLGTSVVFDVVIVPLSNSRVVIATFIGSPELRASLDSELSATLASISAEGAR